MEIINRFAVGGLTKASFLMYNKEYKVLGGGIRWTNKKLLDS